MSTIVRASTGGSGSALPATMQAALDAHADLITEFGQNRPVLNPYTGGAYPSRPDADVVLWMGPTQPVGTFGPNDVWLPTVLTGRTLLVPDGTLNPAVAAGAWPAANRAVFARFSVTTAEVWRYLNWNVGTQSGNVQAGIVKLNPGTTTATYTRVVSTGVIACPAAGDLHTDLGSTTLLPGDYAAFIWADNTTVQLRTVSTSGGAALRVCGHESSLTGGVPSSGTVSWSGQYVALSLEAG